MPALLSDPSAPLIPSPSSPLSPIVTLRVTLRDGSLAAILPFTSPSQVPSRLSDHVCGLLNAEIDQGDTFPMTTHMAPDAFRAYWFGNFAAVMLLLPNASYSAEDVYQRLLHPDPGTWTKALAELDQAGATDGAFWAKTCLGTYYVKPNYPGRSSHVCNAGFLVEKAARGKGVGRRLGESYVIWAGRLGYKSSIFNLVYDTNEASKRIWDALGFQRVGRVKGAGNLACSPDKLVDAIVFGRDLSDDGGKSTLEDADAKPEEQVRKVETGKVGGN